jgi:hypothetical protein
MYLTDVNQKIISSLSPNGVWNKGTAPSDRFQALNQEMQTVEQDVFTALNNKGQGAASPADIQKVQKELEKLTSDIQTSPPSFPEPSTYIQPLINKANAEGDNPEQWDIAYSTASPNAAPLVDYLGNVGDSGYSSDNHIANHLSTIASGVQNIEQFVVKAMQDPLPFQQQTQRDDIFWEKKKSVILTNHFNQALSDLGSVTAAAAAVNKDGLSVTGSTQYTYYIPVPIGKIMTMQPRTVINDFAIGPDGKWHSTD